MYSHAHQLFCFQGYGTQHEIPLVHRHPALGSDGGFRIPTTIPVQRPPSGGWKPFPTFPGQGPFNPRIKFPYLVNDNVTERYEFSAESVCIHLDSSCIGKGSVSISMVSSFDPSCYIEHRIMTRCASKCLVTRI